MTGIDSSAGFEKVSCHVVRVLVQATWNKELSRPLEAESGS